MPVRMVERLPLFPTLLVGAAAALMVALGFWQLGRAEWKDDLIARYGTAQTMSAPVAWPRTAAATSEALYRRSELTCERVLAIRSTAGRSAKGQSGWAHIADCAIDGGGNAEVALGWTYEPRAPDWQGGPVTGYVAPSGGADSGTARLVASPPQAGLEQLARPDPNDLPNNHLSYAVQWFFFAATAIVIYALALRKRHKDGG